MVEEKPDLFADEQQAMVDLGVGKNMVRAIRFWAQASGTGGVFYGPASSNSLNSSSGLLPNRGILYVGISYESDRVTA